MNLKPEDLKAGSEIPSLTKDLVEERLTQADGSILLDEDPEKSIYRNVEYARQKGMPGILIAGVLTMSLISEMLQKAFGERWVKGGKLSVTFINMAFSGDVVTAKAVVKERAPEDPPEYLPLEVWMENQRGEKTVVGSAAVPL